MFFFFDKVWSSSKESNLHARLRSIARCSDNQVGFFPSHPADKKARGSKIVKATENHNQTNQNQRQLTEFPP